MVAVEADESRKQILLDHHVIPEFHVQRSPRESVRRAQNHIQGGFGEVTKESDILAADDSAIFFAKVRAVERAFPFPFDGKSGAMFAESALDFALVAIVFVGVNFRALRENRRGFDLGRQPLPEKYVRVDVDEGLELHAVAHQFAERPPARINVVETVKLGGDMREWQAELFDKQLLTVAIGDEDRFGIVFARRVQRKAPRQKVLQPAPPGNASARFGGPTPVGQLLA